MSLRSLFQFGKRLLKGKKESATPATGQQQKQITYEPKPSQAQGQELAVQEIKNPPIVLKKTKPLQMGDDVAPAFGSSTYDWIMRKGRGSYTADEWLDHLTSTRKVNFTVFGKPSSRIERTEKKFKYDSGPFAGKEVNISKEELFDTNIAAFDERGDLIGGMLAAAKKFGVKLNANELGAMVKLNPLNRLKPVELGLPAGTSEKVTKKIATADKELESLFYKYKKMSEQGQPVMDDVAQRIADARYSLSGVKNAPGDTSALLAFTDDLKYARNLQQVTPDERKAMNKIIGEINETVAPIKNTRTRYGNETNYTLQGGKDYRETIFTLPEEIPTNTNPFNKGGHFTDVLDDKVNNIYHVRFDTRFTPDGKKVFFINEIQSDVNQTVAKNLSKAQQLDPKIRVNPFQKDIEMRLMINEKGKLVQSLANAAEKGDDAAVQAFANQSAKLENQLRRMGGAGRGTYNYYPMVEADQYGDHALKYLMQRAARENVDYVAVAPFDKLSFRQGYKAGNERFYGYANGKGINKSGSAVVPNLMKRAARLYGSKAGPTKVSLSDPSKPYKKISTDTFKYPERHKLSGKKIESKYHIDASNVKDSERVFIESSNPALYFDAFAIKVNPLMRGTQKTYKALGGLVVDMFKPIRYN